MINRRAVFLLLVFIGSAAGAWAAAEPLDAATWARTAVERMAEPPKPEERNSYPPSLELRLGQLLQQLPAPEEWTAISAALGNEALDFRKGNFREARARQLLRLLMDYLLADSREKLHALVSTMAAAREAVAKGATEGEGERVQLQGELDRLAQMLQQRLRKEAGPEALDMFMEELKRLTPVREEDRLALFGSAEMAAAFARYMEETMEFQKEALKLYQDGKEPDESVMQEWQKKMMAFQEQHREVVDLLQEIAKDPERQELLVRMTMGESEDDYVPSLDVPDLVALAGEEKARELLREALSARATLSLPEGKETRRLAEEVALENVEKLQVPQWELLEGAGKTVPLYEAMMEKFGQPEGEGYAISNWRRATAKYAFALVIAGREKDALDTFEKVQATGEDDAIPYDLVSSLREQGYGNEVWKFLREAILRDPESEAWDDFITLSSLLERKDDMQKMAEEIVRGQAPEDPRLLQARSRLAQVYLAVDRVDEALALLREVVKTPVETKERREVVVQAAATLVELGMVLEREDLAREGAMVLKRVQPLKWQDNDAYPDYGVSQQVTHLLEILPEEAKELLTLYRKAADRQTAKEGHQARQDADLLLATYVAHERGEHEKVLALAREETRWQFADLADPLRRGESPSQGRPLAYMLAVALAETGAKEEALRLLESEMKVNGGFDPAFALYANLKGRDAVPLLERLFEVDRYQERPLIWKGRILLDAGETEEAEKSVRAAIATDPSDGEQPRGDRMRAYAVLQEVAQKQGKADEAEMLQGVMKAIRLSEEADRFFSVGLMSRAIGMYQEALGFFADAYCIQSRLAIQLTAAGRMEEAMEHYQKAYELMPDSFGRVESHCFGCERAFDGERQQSVAEKVFRKMVETRPDDPQVFYLMGYLLAETERKSEAVPYFEKAVELDPLYLNAWKKLADLATDAKMAPDAIDRITLKLIQLDPLRGHSSPSLGEVGDLPALWRALKGAEKEMAKVPIPEELFLMKAAAAAIEKLPEQERPRPHGERGQPSPAAGLMEHAYIEMLARMER